MRRTALAQQLNIILFSVATSSFFTITYAQVMGNEGNVDTINSIDLGSLVVTASGFAQEVKDAPASISVIGQETINEKPFNNIGDVLKDVEGVNISRGGKSGGVNIGIRGLGNDYTLLLVDGQRLSQNSSGARPNGFGDVDSSFIPPSSAIERIEVVRGPMSTLYGSDALGGVINVITKKVPEKWGGQVSFSIEEPTSSKFSGGNTTSFYVAGPIKNDLIGLALMGSFQTKRNAKGTYAINEAEVASGVHTGKLANFSGLGERKNFNYGARLTFTPENQEFVLSYDRGVQRYENDDNQLGTQNSTIEPGKTGGGYADHMHFIRERVGLTHRAELDFATVESGLLWDQTKTLGRLNPLVADKNSATGYTSLSGAQRDIKYTNIVFDNKWMFSLGDHFISAGMQYRQQKLKDNLEGANIDKKQYQWALFAEDEWMLNDNLIGTLGLRYDKNEDFGSHFSPRAYLVWNINDHWQIKGGVSRAFKAPDVQLMSPGVIGLGRQGRLPLLGNPDLKPETATSAELGFSFDNQDNFRFNATAFYTKFKDRIESQTVANCRLDPSVGCVSITGDDKNSKTFSKRFNVDDAKLYGLELGAKFQVLDNLGLSANYTYTHSSYTNNQGQKIPFSTTPQHMVNLRADWKVAAQWNLWVEGEYRAKEYDDLNWNKEKVYYRNYALVNIGANYKPSREMNINFGVDNLFDKDFVDYSVAQTGTTAPTTNTEFQNRYARVEEGRRLWLKLNYEF